MSEQLQISQDYKLILSQIKSICEDEKDIIANLANITALLLTAFNHHWIGFYFYDQPETGPGNAGRCSCNCRIGGTVREKN